METSFIAKEFFEKTIKSKNLESRSEDFYVNFNDRSNYIFNSKLQGIEDSDLIVLIGANPRYEATILNTRIRKNYIKNKTEIYSFGNIGDLTYPYKVIENNTKIIKDVINNNHDLSKKIINSKKPLIILGQSVLKIKSAKYIFEDFKNFLLSNDKISDDWNSLNILSNKASTVGSYDLGIFSSNNGKNLALEEIKNNRCEVIFLFGQDDLKFNKKKEFIIYIGSHGDRGAEMADIILPGSAYTEQDGYFTNLEGIIQKAYKASYPPGEAKEDWLIINELSANIKRNKLYSNKDELVSSMMNYLNINKKNDFFKLTDYEFYEEKIIVDDIDYYLSNAIARASKTMNDCKKIKLSLKKTGTEG